jgi:hypothetical protein
MGLLEQELQSQAGELPGGDNSTARFIPIEALELQGDEPKGLDFHHASVRVNATETAEGTEYSAVFEHEPLQGRAFFKFLYHIAPAPEGDNVSAVYYDWRLPDKPNYKFAGRDNPELIRLHAAHLGRHWVDFEGSRSDFMVALLSGQDPSSVLKDLPYTGLKLHDEAALRRRLDPSRMSFSRLDAVFDIEGFPDPTTTVAGYMRDDGAIGAKTHRRILAGRREGTLSKVFNQDRERYNSRYLEELDDGQEEVAFQTYVRDRFLEVVTEDGSVRYASKLMTAATQAELQEAYESRQSIFLPGYIKPPLNPATYVIDRTILDQEKASGVIYFPHSLRPSRHSLALQPILQWRTTARDGEAVQRELVVDEKDEEDPSGPIDQPRLKASNLAGLLALAYLSPSVRDG